jgi:hypothetical protein
MKQAVDRLTPVSPLLPAGHGVSAGQKQGTLVVTVQ